MLWLAVTLHLLVLTGPDGLRIEVNSDEIVTLRPPRGQEQDHIHKNIHCVIFTTDGKFVSVTETCDKVHELMDEDPQ